VNEFNLPLSPGWVQSVESETRPELAEIGRLAREVIPSTQFRNYVLMRSIYSGDGSMADVASSVVGLSYYKEAPRSEKGKIEAALFGDASWIYTTQSSDDGLWKDVVASRAAPVDVASRLVLSGALGDSLFEADPALLAMAEKYRTTYLDRAILVGGAALAAETRYLESLSTHGYYASLHVSEQLQWQTYTGGTLHGDFRTSRSARPIGSVKDTIDSNREHHFMPAIYDERAAAYHSTELGILGALLFHLVVNKGVEASTLLQTLYERLETLKIHVGGAFADYGYDDGEREARELYDNLKHEKPKTYRTFYSSVVHPNGDNPERFHIDLQPDGVVMCNRNKKVELSRMMIPNEEIEEYIVALISGGGGRTSPRAMIRVIDALVGVGMEDL